MARNRIGEHDFTQQKIRIDVDNPQEEIVNTLIHEIFHACYQVMDLDREIEEKTVTCMANIFTQVVYDNPHFLEYLIKETKKEKIDGR